MKPHIRAYLKATNKLPEEILCENCSCVAQDLHHLLKKSQGGSDKFENIIALCRPCHDRAHFKQEPYLHEEELFRIKNL